MKGKGFLHLRRSEGWSGLEFCVTLDTELVAVLEGMRQEPGQGILWESRVLSLCFLLWRINQKVSYILRLSRLHPTPPNLSILPLNLRVAWEMYL